MMSQVPVTIEDTEFLDHFLALPPGIPLTSHLTERKSSPFTALELANKMIEELVFDAFVRPFVTFPHISVTNRLVPCSNMRSTRRGWLQVSSFANMKINRNMSAPPAGSR